MENIKFNAWHMVNAQERSFLLMIKGQPHFDTEACVSPEISEIRQLCAAGYCHPSS